MIHPKEKQEQSHSLQSPASATVSRRDAIKVGATVMAGMVVPGAFAASRRAKKVIIVGGGIAGLSCAYELMERGHDVTVLEASRRTGGHVKTIRDPLPDGLYADVGAEQFPRPGYTEYWGYVEKFGLTALRWDRNENAYRKIGDKWVPEAQLSETKTLTEFGFNARERDYIQQHGWHELPFLYFDPYIAKFKDEYQPLGIGLDELDHILVADLLAKDGASAAALRFFGQGRRSSADKPPTRNDVSALFRVWIAAILRLRGLPLRPRELYHLKGGNQALPDAFAARLGERVRRNCPITAVEHGDSSVNVRFTQRERLQEMSADYLVLCVSPQILAGISVTPAWPEAKAFALANTGMGMGSRVLLQTKTAFWKGDIPSINLASGNRHLPTVCETAQEVPGERRLLFGTGQPVQTPEQTITAFRSFYPGQAADTIEQSIVHQWWKEEPTCVGCERTPFPLGHLAKIWPHLIEPVGRIHFAGAAYDNLWRGMEAATRSALRAVGRIDAA